MCRWIAVIVLALTACGFESSPLPSLDDASPGPTQPDDPVGTADDVVYVGTQDEYVGTDDLTIATPLMIDTGTLNFGMPLPPGATFVSAKQDGGGPDLAILHVHKLDVRATIQVFGPRPFVVIADSIELPQTINVIARKDPSSALPSARTRAVAATGTPCLAPPPDAGGGAIELYARTRILISGYLTVGGTTGGDDRFAGDACPINGLGGASGVIVLQSPSIENSGRLSATGSGDSAAGGGPGQILLLYKTRVASGVTAPTAITRQY
jgi:hypothetical protein